MYTYNVYNLKEIESFTNLHLNTNDYFILLLINEKQKSRDSLCVKIMFFLNV